MKHKFFCGFQTNLKPKGKSQLRGKGGQKKKKLAVRKFTVDCTHPVEDNILDVANFEQYLKERIKINGKTNQLGNVVSLERHKTKLSVNSEVSFNVLNHFFVTRDRFS